MKLGNLLSSSETKDLKFTSYLVVWETAKTKCLLNHSENKAPTPVFDATQNSLMNISFFADITKKRLTNISA